MSKLSHQELTMLHQTYDGLLILKQFVKGTK